MTTSETPPVEIAPALLFDALDVGYWQVAAHLKQFFISRRGRELYGVEGESSRPLVDRVRACVDPSDLERVRLQVLDSIGRREPFHFDVAVTRENDGARRVLRVRGRTIAEGPLAGFTVGTLVDVTDEVRALAELAATRLQLEAAERIGETGSWSWELRTGEMRWSREAYRIAHVPPDRQPSFELVLAMAVDEEHRREFESRVRNALEHGVAYDFEMPARLPNGRLIVLHTRGAIERDESGAAIRMVGTMRDVTAARTAERELLEREARFRLLAESSPNGVFLTNESGATTYASARLLDWFDLTLTDFAEGRWIDRLHPDDRDAVAAWGADPDERRRPFRHSYRIVVGGETRFLRIRTEPLFAPGGELLGHVGSVEDATAEHRAAAERAQLEERVQQARKLESVGLLAGGIAHDFNNLLVGVLANASFAREMVGSDGPTAEALSDIERSALRAAELTRQLLSYAGRASVRREVIDIAEMVTELPGLLGARVPPSVEFTVSLATAQARVLGDRTELRQVVMNLITNAVDSIRGPGRVRVVVAREHCTRERLAACVLGAERAEGEYVTVSVEDSGSGMPKDVMDRMFDPFYSTKGTGRGLGLAATLGLLNSHAGCVSVQSRPDEGTRVRVLLPASDDAVPAQALEPESGPSSLGQGLLLLADDDLAARTAARRVLQRTGYRVIEAEDGAQAVARFEERAGRWACVVLDLTMPVMTGDVALKEIRARDGDVPVLIISGYAPEDVAARVHSMERVQVLQKPYSSAELLRAIEVARGGSGRPTGT